MHVTLLETDMVVTLGYLAASMSWNAQRTFNFFTGYPVLVSDAPSDFVAIFLMRFLVWRYSDNVA